MKVLLIDVNCKNSSTGRIVYNIYNYLNDNGYSASICYGRGDKIDEKNIFKFGLDWETNLHALLTRLTGFTGCFSFFSTKRLLQYIDMFQPDVVHIHELHAYFVNIVPLLKYLAKRRIKVVHTLHCEFSYTGKCGHSMDCNKWKTECRQCPRVHNYPRSWFFDQTKAMHLQKKKCFQKFHELTITTPSEWLTQRAKQSFFADRAIYTIHNGIDTNIFFPREYTSIRTELGIGLEEKVVLALAPHLMSDEKGGAFILKLAKRMNGKAIFILVGVDGETMHKEDNTIFMGPVYDKDRLAELYSMADVFCICSMRENYPTTCLEAQACGTPICGFNTGGTVETCIINPEGRFADYGDIIGLSHIIDNMSSKPNKESLWLERNAGVILGVSEMTKKYVELYEN